MFEGSEYLETKQLPLKEIAKRAKAEILEKYPEIKVSVRTRDYNAIDVEITAIPKDFQPLKRVKLDQNLPYTTINHSDAGQQLLNDIENILDVYNRKDIEIETDYCNVRFFTYVRYSFQISQEAQKLLA
jgi:hypothetical protein